MIPAGSMQHRVLGALDPVLGKSASRICAALGCDPVYAPVEMVEDVRLALLDLSGMMLVYQDQIGPVAEWRLTSLGLERQRSLRPMNRQ